MPKYKTRKRAKAQKRRRRMVAAVPRDKRILMRWAAEGTEKDYTKLNELAQSSDFFTGQMSPRASSKIVDVDACEREPLQPDNRTPHDVTHLAYLTVATFVDHDLHFCPFPPTAQNPYTRLRCLSTVYDDTTLQLGDYGWRGCFRDTDPVRLVYAIAGMRQPIRKVAVIG